MLWVQTNTKTTSFTRLLRKQGIYSFSWIKAEVTLFIFSSIFMRRRGPCLTKKPMNGSEVFQELNLAQDTSLSLSPWRSSWELWTQFPPPCAASRTKAEARLCNIMVEFCLPPCERQASFRWFCLLLISLWSFRCVSPKTWVWIPEGCALFPKNNAPFAHRDVENVVSNLEVVLPAVAEAVWQKEPP